MARRGLPFELSIAKPCGESWAAMQGDGRARHCEHCQKTVHNLAAMTAREIEALVHRSNGGICARITHRADGSLVMQDARPKSPVILQAAATALLTVGAAGAAAQSRTESAALPQAGQLLPQGENQASGRTASAKAQQIHPSNTEAQKATEPQPQALMGEVVVVEAPPVELASDRAQISALIESQPLATAGEANASQRHSSLAYILRHPIQYARRRKNGAV